MNIKMVSPIVSKLADEIELYEATGKIEIADDTILAVERGAIARFDALVYGDMRHGLLSEAQVWGEADALVRQRRAYRVEQAQAKKRRQAVIDAMKEAKELVEA